MAIMGAQCLNKFKTKLISSSKCNIITSLQEIPWTVSIGLKAWQELRNSPSAQNSGLINAKTHGTNTAKLPNMDNTPVIKVPIFLLKHRQHRSGHCGQFTDGQHLQHLSHILYGYWVYGCRQQITCRQHDTRKKVTGWQVRSSPPQLGNKSPS